MIIQSNAPSTAGLKMTPSVRVDRIGQIHISVDDLGDSVRFYRDVLGLSLLMELPEQSMAFFDCGGVRLYLGKPETPDFHSGPLIYYSVADLAATCEAISAMGVAIDEPPHLVHQDDQIELWMAGLRDPSGHHLCLMTERARSDA